MPGRSTTQRYTELHVDWLIDLLWSGVGSGRREPEGRDAGPSKERIHTSDRLRAPTGSTVGRVQQHTVGPCVPLGRGDENQPVVTRRIRTSRRPLHRTTGDSSP